MISFAFTRLISLSYSAPSGRFSGKSGAGRPSPSDGSRTTRRARADDAPRVSSETRDAMIARIDRIGEEEFSREAVGNPEAVNPELLRVAHGFASERRDYAHAMQGLALLHEALLLQSQTDRRKPHAGERSRI